MIWWNSLSVTTNSLAKVCDMSREGKTVACREAEKELEHNQLITIHNPFIRCRVGNFI